MLYKIAAIKKIQNSLSVIVPAYNEGSRIESNLIKIAHFLQKNTFNSEIIVVNDGSSDNTAEIVTAFQRTSPVPVTHTYHNNKGKGFSVKKGMLMSEAELRLFTDADGATDIYETLKLYNALQTFFADGSIASRALPDSIITIPQPFHRKITGNTLRLMTRLTILPKIYDTQCGFKMFSKEFTDFIFPKLTIDGFAFDLELLYLAKLFNKRIVEVPVVWEDQAGSKVDPVKEGFRFLKTIGILLSNRIRHKY